MKYLVINPYGPASHGIANYIKALKKKIKIIEIESLDNNKCLSPEKFQEYVRDVVTSKYGFNDVIIEAPEAKASTILLPKNYNVHIRLHCPLAVAQKYDGFQPNQKVYSDELRAIYKAKVVSSPSYGLLSEMKDEICDQNKYVFKNPVDLDIKAKKYNDKEYDAVFMGRFQTLKGIEYINSILERLPKNYKVLLIGENSNTLKLGKKIFCDVTRKGHLSGDERFDLVGRSKVLMMLSKFENCSMVILESLACGTPVVAWNVGGNSEIAEKNVLKTVQFEDVDQYVSAVREFSDGENYPDELDFITAINEINRDFDKGLKAVVNSMKTNTYLPYKGFNKSSHHHGVFHEPNRTGSKKVDYGKRVLGFTISNEHIEELWGGVVDKLGLDYRYVCRRPLGFHTVFNRKPHPVKRNWFTQFDWISSVERLEKYICNFRPNKLLFHNGSHPMYKEALDKLSKLGVPIIYSELGWFPQKNHVYFDKWGVNGKSYLASLTAESLCQKTLPQDEPGEKVTGDFTLVVTQLENDTNLIVNSALFKNNYNFVKHVIESLPNDEEIIVKVHPLDKGYSKLNTLQNKRIKVVKDYDTGQLLSKAHSLVGINSTVLLQALEYDVNIYSFGRSILDNKKVSIDCSDGNIKERFTKEKCGNKKRRIEIVRALKDRQINLNELPNMSQEFIDSSPAFEVFRENNLEDFTSLIAKGKQFNKSDNEGNHKKAESVETDLKIVKEIIVNPSDVYLSRGMRKVKKLIKNPVKFFADSKITRKIFCE